VVVYFTVNDALMINVVEADERTGGKWINHLPRPRDGANYSLTVDWKDRYKSDARYADAWLKAAKPWTPGNVPCTPSNNCVDDNHGYRYINQLLTFYHTGRLKIIPLCQRCSGRKCRI